MKNKINVVLITGASSGIGYFVSNYLSGHGMKVYGCSRSKPPEKRNFRWIQTDITDRQSVQATVERILTAEGKIDVLVNNAGVGSMGALEELPMELIDQVLDTNVRGTIMMMKAVLPGMRERGAGLIINITSVAGLIGLPGRTIYSTSKAALEGLSQGLRLEVKQFGIRVCTVVPGGIKTEIGESRAAYNPPSSPYHSFIAAVERVANRDVAEGLEKEAVAVKIMNLIFDPDPPERNIIAKPLQRLSPALKRLLPQRLYDKLVLRYFSD